MDLYRAIQIGALQAVMLGSPDYDTRKILRWFSKTFFTPITAVEELPFEEVLQAYYEEHYESMDEEALERAKLELLETKDERAARLKKEDAEQADADQYARQIAEEEATKKKAASTTMPTPDKQLPIATVKAERPFKQEKETELPTSMPVLPDLTMKFDVSEEDFEKEIDAIDNMGTLLKR